MKSWHGFVLILKSAAPSLQQNSTVGCDFVKGGDTGFGVTHNFNLSSTEATSTLMHSWSGNGFGYWRNTHSIKCLTHRFFKAIGNSWERRTTLYFTGFYFLFYFIILIFLILASGSCDVCYYLPLLMVMKLSKG